jgi:hypothetical protein
MLADFLTMHEASGKPYHALTYAFVGDCRYNMGRSLLIMGALMGSDVRLSGPAELHPPKDVVGLAMDIAGRTGARNTVTEDPAQAVAGADFIHTDMWVSMGESQRRLGRTGQAPDSLPGQRRPAGQDRQPPGQVHALPAGVPRSKHDAGPRDHGVYRHDHRPRSNRRGLRIRGQHRLRPGREPAAHHQAVLVATLG